jgi:hypothetical protein
MSQTSSHSKRTLVPLFAIALVVIAVAGAATPSFAAKAAEGLTDAPLQWKRSITLTGSPADVYAAVSDPAAVLRLSGGVLHDVTVDNARARTLNGKGAVRECTFKGGTVIRELVRVGQSPVTYAYSLTPDNPMGLADHLGYIEIEALTEGRVHLTWSQYFTHAQAEAMRQQIGGVLGVVFGNLEKQFSPELAPAQEGTR